MKRLIKTLGLVAVLGLSACEAAATAKEELCALDVPDTHSTAQGFTPWPADLSSAGVERTYEFVASNANMIAHHFDGGVPWQQALEGGPLPQHLVENWNLRAAKTPADFKTFVAITPLNFDRDGLALAWTDEGENQALTGDWRNKSFDDADVQRAYLNYARNIIARFDPDFLAIGIEANIMISKAPDRWDEYLALNAFVYAELKRQHPDLPIFTTIQYEHLRGIEDTSKPNADLQSAAVRTLMQHSDLMAVSTYKYGLYHPNPMGPDYFDIAESFGKQVAIAESGAMSSKVRIFGTKLRATEEDQNCFVNGILSHAARNNYPFVVNWVAVDFDPMIKKLPKPLGEVAKAWVHTGLQTAKGKDKPALEVWSEYLAAYVPAHVPEGVLE